jgi:hypothetical protein
LKLLAGMIFLAAMCRAEGPVVTFIKSFPGSIPPYVSLKIDHTGAMEYKEAPDDAQPLDAKLSPAQTQTIFDLADKLQHFKEPLESGLKVANTGKKIFRYEDASGVSTEATFNYSLKPDAQQLLDKFEQISSTERAFIDLDRTTHFDKLGVNDALAEVEALWVRKQLAAPEQFLPLLTYITKHESFMHLVRDRASRLKDEFTAPVTVTPAEAPSEK